MAKPTIKVSVREYAKTLGISHPTVLKAIAAGKIKKGVSYRKQTRNGIESTTIEINQAIADLEFGNLHKSGKVKPGQKAVKVVGEKTVIEKSNKLPLVESVTTLDEDDEAIISSMKITSDMSFAEAARHRELIGLVMDKKKLQEAEGVLVRKDVVDSELFAFGTELKKSLLNIPARVTADVRAASNDVEAQMIITVEITNILNDFSKKQSL